MAVNLSRNTKVYFTTLVGATNNAFTNNDTWEVQVQDGYSFTQSTEQQTIQINEAGNTPNRGQRAFNTKLNPVDWNFGAYIRPAVVGGLVTASEKLLWNALMGNQTLVAPASYSAVTTLTKALVGSINVGTLVYTSTTVPLVGQVVNVTGVTEAGWNGEFKIKSVSSAANVRTITFDYAAAPTGTATTTSAKVATCPWYETAAFARATFLGSNSHQLQAFSLVFLVDNVYYKVDNCAINTAEVQFDIAGISMINWSGFGAEVVKIDEKVAGVSGAPGVALALITPVVTTGATAGKFITNKLSTVTFNGSIGGAGTAYSVPITGGNITISNNVEYVTPEILGVVNKPIGYFTGTRSISGSLNAYLRTGAANDTSSLLNQILTDNQTTTETKYMVQIEVGGKLNANHVDFKMNACQIQVPTVDIQDVVSTNINFTAQGYSGADYDIEQTNDLSVTYYSV